MIFYAQSKPFPDITAKEKTIRGKGLILAIGVIFGYYSDINMVVHSIREYSTDIAFQINEDNLP